MNIHNSKNYVHLCWEPPDVYLPWPFPAILHIAHSELFFNVHVKDITQLIWWEAGLSGSSCIFPADLTFWDYTYRKIGRTEKSCICKS